MGVQLSTNGALVISGSADRTVKLWQAGSNNLIRALRLDRPYERMNISGLIGVTDAQRTALLASGAIEETTDQSDATNTRMR
jgi:WD40 repeat protein